MKLKNEIILIVFSALNFIVCLALIVFKIPNQIPAVFNAAEKCVALTNKWVLMMGAVFPIIFATVAIVFYKRRKLSQSAVFVYYLAL